MKISPIFYMGNKKKLINKGLIELFPKNISMFVDLFAGSGIVSMNTEASKYIINDIDTNLISLYNMFKFTEADTIINHIEKRIEEYGLPKEYTKRNTFKDKEKLEQYKKAYMALRSDYNKNKDVLNFYTLMFYSFSQQFRFNNKGEFNMPFGNGCFSDKNKEYIRYGIEFFKEDNVIITNNDFRKLNIGKLDCNSFVYLDPPYLDTTATYNEKGGWTIKDEQDIYNICEELNDNGIKFGMSNVFANKGRTNDNIIEWCNKNKWEVYTFDKFTYYACGKGSANTKEVFIRNY